jgi:hypothetical protein
MACSRAAWCVASVVALALSWSTARASEGRLEATVTKIEVVRHRLRFTTETDLPQKNLDDYARFLESVRKKDVIGINLVYQPPMIPLIGIDQRALRLSRLQAAYNPIAESAKERGLNIAVFDLSESHLAHVEFDWVEVEVILRRK